MRRQAARTAPRVRARKCSSRWLASFQVKADGNWTLLVEPLRNGGQPAFSGTGDNVRLFFDPPPPGQWLISATRKMLLIQLHCVSSDADVVDDDNGPLPYLQSAMITFSRGPCF
jgi:hypothetical protein